ncbi:MAG: hypothetical protein ACRD2W_13775 [Acidimicrobiales bacterium]
MTTPSRALPLLLPPRRRHQARRLAAILAASIFALGAIVNGATAKEKDISLVGGQYRGPVCYEGTSPDPGLSDTSFTGQPAAEAVFSYNGRGIAVGGAAIYIADLSRSRIHRISGGVIHTVAGGGLESFDSGQALAAAVSPVAIAVHPNRPQDVYFVDLGDGSNIRLRKLTDGQITTIASISTFSAEFGLAVDGQGTAYVAGSMKSAIDRISQAGTTTIATGSTGVRSLGLKPSGDVLYVAEQGGDGASTGKLFRVDLVSPEAATSPIATGLARATGVTVDRTGRLFVAEGLRGVVEERDPETGKILQRVAGRGMPGATSQSTPAGPGESATLSTTIRLAVDNSSPPNIYIQDADNCVVRMVESMPAYTPPTTAKVEDTTPTTIGSSNDQPPPRLEAPTALATDPQPGTSPANQPVDGSEGVPGGASQGGGGSSAAGQLTFTPRAETAIGNEAAASTGGFPGGPDAAAGAQVGAAPGSAGPPPPGGVAAQQAVGGVPVGAGQAPPLGQSPALVGSESPQPRGAARYAMVAHERGGFSPAAMVASMGLVGFFACGLALAARREGPRNERVVPLASRARGAY